jgi:hypothetical protein
MARTIADIYAEIVAYKDSQLPTQLLAPQADSEQQLMAALNSTSKVAIWRLWAYITAVAIHVHELLFDTFKLEVEATLAAGAVGTVKWYQAQVFNYQHGDVLVYDTATGKYIYALLDASKKVVKRCSITETPKGLIFKVAKLSGVQPVGLAVAEQTGLAAYLKKVRFAGTLFQVVSGNGDVLKVSAKVYYDPIIPQATVKAQVEAAVVGYVGNLPFDGELFLSALVDVMQAVEGVRDVTLSSVQRKANAGDPYANIVRADVPVYGYYQLDSASSNQIAQTINYTAI